MGRDEGEEITSGDVLGELTSLKVVNCEVGAASVCREFVVMVEMVVEHWIDEETIIEVELF